MTRNSHRSIRPTPSIPRYTVSSHDIISINLFIFVSFFSAAAGQSKTESPSSSYLSGNTDTSTAILVVVLVCAFLITGCLSLYIRGCSGFDESSFTTITTTGRSLSVIVVPNGDGRSRRGRGLDRSVIDTFPTFLYSEVKESKTGKGTLECAVCLSEFEDEEKLRLLTKCDHVFHTDCIDKWLSAHKTCPVCRANLVPSSEESAEMENTVGNQSESDSNLSEPDTEEGDRGQHCDCRELTRQVRMATVDESQGRQVVQSIDGVKENNHQVPVIDDNRRYHLRSHSTGHSLIQPRCADEYHERFRLRLPEEVRNQIIISSELKRVASSVALSGDSSSRSEYKRDGDGEDGSVTGGGNRRSAGWLAEWWWMTAAAPSADREGNQVSSSRGILTNVAAPFERAGGKQEPAGSQSQIRPPV